MRTVLSALLALSVLTGATASAYAAFDAQKFWEQEERFSR